MAGKRRWNGGGGEEKVVEEGRHWLVWARAVGRSARHRAGIARSHLPSESERGLSNFARIHHE
jgi:hypothetical protein